MLSEVRMSVILTEKLRIKSSIEKVYGPGLKLILEPVRVKPV